MMGLRIMFGKSATGYSGVAKINQKRQYFVTLLLG